MAGDEDGQPAGGLGRVALHGIGRTGISVLAIVLTQLVSTAILARLLSPAEFGVVAAANVAILFGQLISDLGLSSAVIRHVDLTPAHVRTAFTVSLLVGATLAAAVAGFADPIAAMLRIEASAGPLRLLAASFLWFGLAGISHALLHRALRFGTVALIDAVAALLCNGVLTVALALAGWGYWALATGAVAHSALRAIWMIAVAPHDMRPMIDRGALRDLGMVGAGFSVGALINFFARHGDIFMVARFAGPAALGLYDRAFRLAFLPSRFYDKLVGAVSFSTISLAQDDLPRMQRAMLRAMGLIALIGMPSSVALALLGPEIIRVFLGPAWSGAVVPFQILACATFLRFGYRIGQTVIHARGRVWLYAATQVVFAAGIVGGAWWQAIRGPEAVAVVVAAMMAVNFLMLTGLALREIRLSPWAILASWGPGALNALAVGLAVAGALHGLRPVAPPAAALGGAVAAGTAWALLVLLFGGRRLLGEDGLWLRAELRRMFAAGSGRGRARR